MIYRVGQKVIPLVQCNVMHERYHFFVPPCMWLSLRESYRGLKSSSSSFAYSKHFQKGFLLVLQQLTRLQLKWNVARSLCNSWASCLSNMETDGPGGGSDSSQEMKPIRRDACKVCAFEKEKHHFLETMLFFQNWLTFPLLRQFRNLSESGYLVN